MISLHQATTSFKPAAAPQSPQDRVLAGLVLRGHGREAIAAYLGLTEDALMNRVVHLGLPTPPNKPLRTGHGKTAWAVVDTRRLIDLWCRNFTVKRIAESLARKEGGVASKARRLGLFRRDHRSLLRELPLFPTLDLPKPKRRELVWTEALENQLADRWFAMQRHTSIARDLSDVLGQQVSPTTIASKAHRMQLPRRDAYFLLDGYDPANRAKHAHLLPKLVRRICPIRHAAFYAPPCGDRISAEAKRLVTYQALSATVH